MQRVFTDPLNHRHGPSRRTLTHFRLLSPLVIQLVDVACVSDHETRALGHTFRFPWVSGRACHFVPTPSLNVLDASCHRVSQHIGGNGTPTLDISVQTRQFLGWFLYGNDGMWGGDVV